MHLFGSGKTRCLSLFVLWIAVTCAFTACGGGGSSSTTTQNPSPSPNPAPSATSVSPTSAVAGAPASTITVNGSGFIQSSTVQWNQSSRTTTFVSSTQLQAAVTAADLATAGTAQITVTNPAPGGGTSAAASFTINNPVPAIASLLPSSATAGAAAFILIIRGIGFVSDSTVQWNQSTRPTTVVSSTQLQFTVSAADLAAGGAQQITVTNAAPGGGTSAAAAFTVNNPVPQVASVSPMTLTTNDTGTTFTVNGSGFVPNSTVTINGANRTTTFVSSSQLQAQLVASDVAAVGSLQVSVSNPTPGGGAGTAAALTIVYPVPSLSSISPTAVSAGGPSFTLTVNGSGFQPTSGVKLNSLIKVPTYVSSTMLQVNINAADIANQGSIPVAVVTGTPGGGTSQIVNLVVGSFVVPTITSVNPASIVVNTPGLPATMQGTGFTQFTTVQINGSSVPAGAASSTFLSFQIPASALTSVGPLSVTVTNPGTVASNAVTINVTPNPVPTLTSLSPNAVAVGSPGFTLTVGGSNFSPGSVIQWNGSPRPTTFSGFQLTATISAADVQSLGNNIVTVVNPAPGGGTSSPLGFTTFLPMPANALVYNPNNRLLYASVPSSGGPSLGNSIVPIDPYTGNLGTPIFVGSEPGTMALSSDGSALWVALNGAAAVREVNLTNQTAGLQFTLGGGTGVYNPPAAAKALAVMPGQPNTVAVAGPTNFSYQSLVTIYDSGVARTNAANGAIQCCSGISGLAFDSTGTKLYEVGSGYGVATVDSTGITSATSLNSTASSSNLDVDNGRAYLTTGIVLDANLGNQLGVFSVGQNQNANGPVVSDSSIGKAFVLVNSNGGSSTYQINAYDTSNFVLKGSFLGGLTSVFPYPNPTSLVRWGQDGLAFTNGSQIYIVRSNLVRDLSTSLADLSISANPPSSTTTGTDITYNLTISNAGPVTASPATLIDDIPNGSTFKSVTSSQGTCTGGAIVRCDVGDLTSGASATVQIVATALSSGILANTATVSAPQGDPDTTNNSISSSTTVTGNSVNAVPLMMSISPAFVQAGSASFTLTVNGSGFDSASTVQLNGTALPTTFVSSSQLTANIDASNAAALGWSWINVSNPNPGGGVSNNLPLSVYQVVSLDVSRLTFDPFTRNLYASVPGTATQVIGNSLVAVNPSTGTLATPLNIGSQPDSMAESADGNYLYVVLDGSASVTQVDLRTLTQGPTFPVKIQSFGQTTQVTPRGIAVNPANDNLLALDLGSSNGTGLFDIAGSTMTARSKLTGTYTGSDITFANASTLYSYDTDTSGAEFYIWTVTPTGLTLNNNTGYTLNGIGGFGGGYQLANGLVFGVGGGVADPRTTPPTALGQFNVNSAQGTTQSIEGTGIAPDLAIGRVFITGETLAGSANPVLFAYDPSSFELQNMQQFTGSTQGQDLVRWGRDGLAWHTTTSGAFGNNTPGKGQIVLVRGPFVLPEWSTANPAAVLSSVSPSSIAAGGGNNLTLTVTGSNFVPGAVLLWNGAERTTTYVDSGHLSVAIPASDLAQPGTATLVVNNPGSANSSSTMFTIN